ncbi:MAG: hypothetical protein AAGA59_22565 [Actinomycetota bacterium]
MAQHRARIATLLDGLAGGRAFDHPGYIYDLAEFLAAGQCTDALVRRRFVYDDEGASALVGRLVELRLIGSSGRPGPRLGAAAEMLGLRERMADDLWPIDLDAAEGGATALLAAADGPLASAFAALPHPTAAAARLHHLLNGARYIRFDAHVEAWRAVPLDPVEITALTVALDGGIDGAPPPGLLDRGWVADDGQITDAGIEARRDIEDGTNRRYRETLAAVPEAAGWLEALRRLPDR